jgi:membrane protein required for colicin V production
MNWLDLVILLVLAWFTIAGATAGLPREVVTFLAMLAGVVLAGLFHERLANDLSVFTDDQPLARVIGFLAIFLATWGAGQIAVVVFKTQALTVTFGPLDRPGGGVLGFIKGAVLVETVLVLFARYQFRTMTNAIDGSFLAPFFLDAFPFILVLLPGAFRDAVEAFPGVPE